MAQNGGMMQLPYGTYLNNLEQQYGLPQGFLAKTRAVESANGTNLANPNSSARGPFQFTTGTANAMGLSNPMDPYASADAAARLAQQNSKAFTSATGRAPTGQDLYGMHQQGAQGYLTLMNGGTTGQQAMALNGGAGMSGSQMIAHIHGLYNDAKPANLGDGYQQPAATPSQPAPAPAATAAAPATPPDPAQQKFNGGLFGLAQGADYTGQGSGKDMMGKLGDIFGDGSKGSALGTAMAGLTTALAPQQTRAAAPAMQLQDQSNTPNPGFLQMLQRRANGGIG